MSTPQFPTNDNTLRGIERHIISDDARLDALPNRFGRLGIILEMKIYDWMEFLTADYRGGMWNFYRLSNGGFYMAPKTDQTFHMVYSANSFEGALSADASGIAVCLFAMSNLAFDYPDSVLSERFHQLREFALDHPEVSMIFRLID